MTNRIRINADTSEDRMMIRQGGGRNQNNVTITIRKKRKEVFIAIKAV